MRLGAELGETLLLSTLTKSDVSVREHEHEQPFCDKNSMKIYPLDDWSLEIRTLSETFLDLIPNIITKCNSLNSL